MDEQRCGLLFTEAEEVRVESVFRSQAQDLKVHRAPENDISSREDSRHTTECEERETELGVGASVSKGLVLQAQDLSLMDQDPYKNSGHGGTCLQSNTNEPTGRPAIRGPPA